MTLLYSQNVTKNIKLKAIIKQLISQNISKFIKANTTSNMKKVITREVKHKCW